MDSRGSNSPVLEIIFILVRWQDGLSAIELSCTAVSRSPPPVEMHAFALDSYQNDARRPLDSAVLTRGLSHWSPSSQVERSYDFS